MCHELRARLGWASSLCLFKMTLFGGMLFAWPLYLFTLFGWLFIPWAIYVMPIGVLYSLWWFYDRKSPVQGTRPCKAIRQFGPFKLLANYFHVRTIKTAELSADRNYIIASHPHCLAVMGNFLTFATNGTDFGQLFPQIRLNVATRAVYNVNVPVIREIALALGAICCSAESISHVLSSKSGQRGNAVVILPGGERETPIYRRGQYRLYLEGRKGFIRLAIKHGADLVPAFIFGEEKLFVDCDPQEGTLLWKANEFVKRKTNGNRLFYGTSLLSMLLPEQWHAKLPDYLRYGIFPFPEDICCVVGAPIRVERNPEPSAEEIDALHAEYCSQLRALFDQYKCEVGGMAESDRLEFI